MEYTVVFVGGGNPNLGKIVHPQTKEEHGFELEDVFNTPEAAAQRQKVKALEAKVADLASAHAAAAAELDLLKKSVDIPDGPVPVARGCSEKYATWLTQRNANFVILEKKGKAEAGDRRPEAGKSDDVVEKPLTDDEKNRPDPVVKVKKSK